MIKPTYFFIGFLSSVISLFCLQPQAQPTDFESYVTRVLIDREVAGASIARIENGQIVEQFAFSHPDVKEDHVKPDTVFQVGSISKSVAAWTVMTLVRDGKVELDTPVSHYVEKWQLPASEFDAEQVTVRRLLSHSAGLSLHGYPGFPESQPLPSTAESLSGQTGGSGDVYIIQEPGAGFRYSGGGFTLLQLLVEEVTGMPFSVYANQSVLTPLGMTSSSYAPDDSLKARRALPYAVFNLVDYFHFRAEAAASLHSTSGDLAKFALANMTSNSVLSMELVNQLHTPVVFNSKVGVGMGFFIDPEAGLVGHNGANQGWRANLIMLPDTNSGLIVLTNSQRGGVLGYEIRCYWEEHFSRGALKQKCSEGIQSYNQRVQLHLTIASVLFLSGLLLIIGRVISLVKGKTLFAMPVTKRRWFFLALFVIALIGGKVVLESSFGAKLMSGMSTTLTAMQHAPEGIPEIWLCLQFLLLCLIGFTFARKIDNA
ncbi:serine hydrolase domain-containing protein [Ningiella sp. W23]|uniref:serine hydrolase domain-containing protein n=1 Tax=Ningiella sp. W23 TaxID=3023715 RepID=UPI00375752AA